jgi:hypothetical protein
METWLLCESRWGRAAAMQMDITAICKIVQGF